MLTIANTGSNDFSGDVSVAGGTLQQATAPNRLPPGSSVTLSNTAGVLLDLNNLDLAIGSLNGGGSSGGNIALGSGVLTVNAGGTYAGVISGSGQLVKSASGTQTLLEANLYTGGTIVSNGTLAVANVAGSGTGPGLVFIAGGTLQIGTNGTTGSIAPPASGFITNHGTLRYNRSDNLTPAEVITGNGSVRHSGSGVLLFNHDNSYTNTTTIDRNNGVLRITSPFALGTLDGGTTVGGGNGTPVGSGGQLEMSGGVVFAPERLTLGCRGTTALGWVAPSQFVNHDGDNTWTGPIDITTGGSYIAIQSDSGMMRIQGSVSGGPTATGTRMVVLRGVAEGIVTGVISNGPVTTALSVTKGDSGTWTLTATNLYTGSTLVTNTGTLLINGVIGGSDVSVVSGTLGGTGLITAPVTVATDGTLSVGPTVGTLSIENSLNSSGNFVFKLNKAKPQRNDSIAVRDDNMYSGTGTLTVNNVGPGLVAGDKFTLFSKPLAGGAALTIVSGGSVVWNNKLDQDGSIEVVSAPNVVPTTPTNLTFTVSAGIITLSWPDSYLGWSLQAQTNAVGGLSSNWVTVPGSESVTSMNVPIDPAKGSVFYRMNYPQ